MGRLTFRRYLIARLSTVVAFFLICTASYFNPAASAQSVRLSARDEAFLEDLSHRAFLYFLEHADPETGLVLDRARTSGAAHDASHPSHNIASSAATGFGLTALCIGARRGWITRAEARERVRKTLRFFAERAAQEHGWFLHWMDQRTGERRWNSEYSSIDTTLLLGGVLTVRQCFRDDALIVRLATKIYERVDFKWMQAGHPTLISHGWKPETGFLKPHWDTYSEHLMLDLLAVGSPTHSITPRTWRAWKRDYMTYAGYRYITGGPLFIHQYSHAWVDFRNWRESWSPHTDFFANSVAATRAHRAFCISLAKEFPGYSEDVWGITASDSAKGYVAWGGPPRDPAIDGTVVPCAAGGSLMFTPDISLKALRTMREKYGERIYGHYGFTDAFNPNTGWVNPDVIGLDVGITLLSAENLRTGNVWRWFMRNPEIPRAMQLVGLRRNGARTRPEAMRRVRIAERLSSGKELFSASALK
ncbi:MAG TPA: glucoamylase family protein [Pyrinomonadaceae bacterium]